MLNLAASQLHGLAPEGLLTELDRIFSKHSSGRGEEPDQVHRVVTRNYDSLNEVEKALFRRLAVFVGSFSLEAAAAVCNPDRFFSLGEGLRTLVFRGLLKREQRNGELRYEMHNLLRDFARAQLATAGEEQQMHRLHTVYFLALTERLIAGLEAERGTGDPEPWLKILDNERENVMEAMAWIAESGDVEERKWMGAVLGTFLVAAGVDRLGKWFRHEPIA